MLVESNNISTNGFKQTLTFNEYFPKFAAILENNLRKTDKDRFAKFKNYLRILIQKLSETYL